MTSPRVYNASSKTTNRTGVSTRSTPTTSNDDLMEMLLSFKAEVLASNKALSDSQSSQFKSLKDEIKKVAVQAKELKAENAILKGEIDALKVKITSLETNSSSTNPSSVVTKVYQESFERDRCAFNVIIYGVVESTSSSVVERTSHDNATVKDILLPLGVTLPLNFKLVRIGKPRPDSTRPLKLIFTNKEEAKSLLYQYNELKRSDTKFPNGFHLVRDKTQLERQLLRTCHNEMTLRTTQGESNLRIFYENGLPKVGTIRSKNEIHPQRHFAQ